MLGRHLSPSQNQDTSAVVTPHRDSATPRLMAPEGAIPEEPDITSKATAYILDSHSFEVCYQFLTVGMSNWEENVC